MATEGNMRNINAMTWSRRCTIEDLVAQYITENPMMQAYVDYGYEIVSEHMYHNMNISDIEGVLKVKLKQGDDITEYSFNVSTGDKWGLPILVVPSVNESDELKTVSGLPYKDNVELRLLDVSCENVKNNYVMNIDICNLKDFLFKPVVSINTDIQAEPLVGIKTYSINMLDLSCGNNAYCIRRRETAKHGEICPRYDLTNDVFDVISDYKYVDADAKSEVYKHYKTPSDVVFSRQAGCDMHSLILPTVSRFRYTVHSKAYDVKIEPFYRDAVLPDYIEGFDVSINDTSNVKCYVYNDTHDKYMLHVIYDNVVFDVDDKIDNIDRKVDVTLRPIIKQQPNVVVCCSTFASLYIMDCDDNKWYVSKYYNDDASVHYYDSKTSEEYPRPGVVTFQLPYTNGKDVNLGIETSAGEDGIVYNYLASYVFMMEDDGMFSVTDFEGGNPNIIDTSVYYNKYVVKNKDGVEQNVQQNIYKMSQMRDLSGNVLENRYECVLSTYEMGYDNLKNGCIIKLIGSDDVKCTMVEHYQTIYGRPRTIKNIVYNETTQRFEEGQMIPAFIINPKSSTQQYAKIEYDEDGNEMYIDEIYNAKIGMLLDDDIEIDMTLVNHLSEQIKDADDKPYIYSITRRTHDGKVEEMNYNLDDTCIRLYKGEECVEEGTIKYKLHIKNYHDFDYNPNEWSKDGVYDDYDIVVYGRLGRDVSKTIRIHVEYNVMAGKEYAFTYNYHLFSLFQSDKKGVLKYMPVTDKMIDDGSSLCWIDEDTFKNVLFLLERYERITGYTKQFKTFLVSDEENDKYGKLYSYSYTRLKAYLAAGYNNVFNVNSATYNDMYNNLNYYNFYSYNNAETVMYSGDYTSTGYNKTNIWKKIASVMGSDDDYYKKIMTPQEQNRQNYRNSYGVYQKTHRPVYLKLEINPFNSAINLNIGANTQVRYMQPGKRYYLFSIKDVPMRQYLLCNTQKGMIDGQTSGIPDKNVIYNYYNERVLPTTEYAKDTDVFTFTCVRNKNNMPVYIDFGVDAFNSKDAIKARNSAYVDLPEGFRFDIEKTYCYCIYDNSHTGEKEGYRYMTLGKKKVVKDGDNITVSDYIKEDMERVFCLDVACHNDIITVPMETYIDLFNMTDKVYTHAPVGDKECLDEDWYCEKAWRYLDDMMYVYNGVYDNYDSKWSLVHDIGGKIYYGDYDSDNAQKALKKQGITINFDKEGYRLGYNKFPGCSDVVTTPMRYVHNLIWRQLKMRNHYLDGCMIISAYDKDANNITQSYVVYVSPVGEYHPYEKRMVLSEIYDYKADTIGSDVLQKKDIIQYKDKVYEDKLDDNEPGSMRKKLTSVFRYKTPNRVPIGNQQEVWNTWLSVNNGYGFYHPTPHCYYQFSIFTQQDKKKSPMFYYMDISFYGGDYS